MLFCLLLVLVHIFLFSVELQVLVCFVVIACCLCSVRLGILRGMLAGIWLCFQRMVVGIIVALVLDSEVVVVFGCLI